MTAKTIQTDSVEFVRELYPRLREDDQAIERYRAAIDKLPPIVVARGRILVDGFHRWQAHTRENVDTIQAIDLGNLADVEIKRESIKRNASHGQQLSTKDKQRAAAEFWQLLSHVDSGERTSDIAELLSVSKSSVEKWTKDARQAEKAAQQDRAWDMWLDCYSEREIAEDVGVTHPTVSAWVEEKRKDASFFHPPESRQHFDIWQFNTPGTDGDSGWFGRMPAQVVENLLWLYTEPGDAVLDPFAGGGTTIDVCKRMGRRIHASDLNPKQGTRRIHPHDATEPFTLPPSLQKDKFKLIVLDPPYWQQAKGRYSDDAGDLGNQTLSDFYASWRKVIENCQKVLAPGGRIAYIISPTDLQEEGVVDHAFDMADGHGMQIERRIIVPYQTQQATGQQVEWAREKKRLLKLYRDLVVLA